MRTPRFAVLEPKAHQLVGGREPPHSRVRNRRKATPPRAVVLWTAPCTLFFRACPHLGSSFVSFLPHPHHQTACFFRLLHIFFSLLCHPPPHHLKDLLRTHSVRFVAAFRWKQRSRADAFPACGKVFGVFVKVCAFRLKHVTRSIPWGMTEGRFAVVMRWRRHLAKTHHQNAGKNEAAGCSFS